MKKRKANSIKPSNNADIEFEIAKTMDKHEKMKEKKFLELISKIIADAVMRYYYAARSDQNKV